MNFELKPTDTFLEQIEKLSEKSKLQIKKKLELIKQNPFRFKAIHARLYSKVFRVRLSIGSKETRLVYVVLGSKIILVCLLYRNKDYKELENYLAKI